MIEITTGTDFSGVGAVDQALALLGIKQKKVFACDMDKFARQTYCLNYGTPEDIALTKSKRHGQIADLLLKCAKRGEVPPPSLAAEAEEMARKFSFYYPFDVYLRAIPEEPLDLSVHTPPCQSFSLAGKRLGTDDLRGILFFNSHKFIDKNRPRTFILENVKGLLSDDKCKNNKDADYGKTFNEWVNLLGGKSINGKMNLFPHEDAVPYHIYFKVINATDMNIPQNRERIFIVGIRDDEDNHFTFPKIESLTACLKDALDKEVAEKYYLSEKGKETIKRHGNVIVTNQTPKISSTIHAGYFKRGGRDQQYLREGDKIRMLTPRECFRLMDFPDSFTWDCSDTQAYKQAGNSIVRKVIAQVIKKLPLTKRQ